MAKRNIGYPLPAGDAYTSDLACMMLMYPDKPEYRQALFGALDYFGTWLAWEKEPEHKGADAALAWKEAILATRECMEMDYCATIIELLTEIKRNTGVYCCDVIDITDGDRYTDLVEDGEGDVPQNIIDSGYADDAADWAGFDDYKCLIAHLMVNNIAAQVEQILGYMLPAGSILGGIPVLAAVASIIFIDSLSVLVYAIATGASVPFGLYSAVGFLGKPGMTDLVDEMATHHDALACAIYEADGSDDAVQALEDEIDSLFTATEAAVLKNLNLAAQLKALYNGRYDTQDIAEIIADLGYEVEEFHCTCDPDPLDEGANLEVIRFSECIAYGDWDDLYFTVNSITPSVNGYIINVTHTSASGHHFYVELDCLPSSYHAVSGVQFRGISYLSTRHSATGVEQNHQAIAGTNAVHVAPVVGYGRNAEFYGVHSDPNPEFEDDCAAILGGAYYYYTGTEGLELTPDATRKLYLRFTVNGIQTYDVHVKNFRWAINYVP